MKCGTSFFNAAHFRKNILRFAPLWGLYTAWLVIQIFESIGQYGPRMDLTRLQEFTTLFYFLNPIYGTAVALVLFGDLYKGRMCNALHAMPIRRETYFFTNILTGLLFSLVPTLIATVVMPLPVTSFAGTAWELCRTLLGFFGTMNLQFVFYFGVAVLACLLAGRRIAAVILTGLLTYGLVLLCLAVQLVYIPRLYGIRLRWDVLCYLCPPAMLLVNSMSFSFDPAEAENLLIAPWAYLAICALVGMACMGLALALYCRRKLENAGNFLAVKLGEPVYLIMMSLLVGIVLYIIPYLLNSPLALLFLAVGIIAGFWGGMMSLRRTSRVFTGKNFSLCLILLASVIGSIGLTMWDPLGVTRWVPEQKAVASVRFEEENRSHSLTVTQPEDIQKFLEIHRQSLKFEARYEDYLLGYSTDRLSYVLEYTLENGITARRYYFAPPDSQAGQQLRKLMSRVEYVLGVPEQKLAQLAARTRHVVAGEQIITDSREILTLLEAVAADCREETMVQSPAFRDYGSELIDLCLEIGGEAGDSYFFLSVYRENTHTLKWLADHGITTK